MKRILVVGLATVLAAAGNAFADAKSSNNTGSSTTTTVATTAPSTSSGAQRSAPSHSSGSGGVPVARGYPANVQSGAQGNIHATGRVLPSLDRAEILARQAAFYNRYRTNPVQNAAEIELPSQAAMQARHHRGDENNLRNAGDAANRTNRTDESNRTQTPNRTDANDGRRTIPAANTPPHGGRPVLNFNNSNTMNFADACRRHRQPHDGNWWRNHCTTIILIGGGFYAWDLGYWYPAWGYDNYYSNYAYDGPIYGYNGLPPDQIIANVQYALQQLGYFSEAVDGVLGPETQAAIEDYQVENDLPLTGAVDRPLLISLGLIR